MESNRTSYLGLHAMNRTTTEQRHRRRNLDSTFLNFDSVKQMLRPSQAEASGPKQQRDQAGMRHDGFLKSSRINLKICRVS